MSLFKNLKRKKQHQKFITNYHSDHYYQLAENYLNISQTRYHLIKAYGLCSLGKISYKGNSKQAAQLKIVELEALLTDINALAFAKRYAQRLHKLVYRRNHFM